MTNANVVAMLVLIALGCSGWLYDGVIARLEKEGRDQGYRGLLVVPMALLAVLGVWAIAGESTAWWSFVCLLFVGLKPVLGDIKRHMDKRTDEEGKAALGNFKTLGQLKMAGGELTESLTEIVGEEGDTHDSHT